MRDLRRRARLTQQEFAERLGLRRISVARYEAGRIPRIKILKEIARVGGVSVVSLIATEDESISPPANGNESQADAELPLPLAPSSIIIRPRGSHAGVGLEKVDDAIELSLYLDERDEQEFFLARFVDYASEDGLYRKYRVVFVDGQLWHAHRSDGTPLVAGEHVEVEALDGLELTVTPIHRAADVAPQTPTHR